MFFFVNDGLFAFFLLGIAEEDGFVLIVLIEGLALVVDGFHFCLPFFAHLVELFVGALVCGDIAHDVFHVDEGKLLGLCTEREGYSQKQD